MKAILLAGGEGKRCRPLTCNKPKALLKVLDKILIEHNLELLQGIVDEVIINVHYKKEMIQDHLGNSYKGMPITYVDQHGDHVEDTAKSLTEGKVIVMSGDSLHTREDIEQEAERLESTTVPVWLSIIYPWNYLEANVALVNEIQKSEINGTIEKGVVIKGIVHIGTGTVIKSGTYIEGPVFIGDNCTIGPRCYVRKDTVIMDNVTLRAEVYDTVLMDNVTAKHDSYLGHSVIGENVNIGAGTITADYRHDGKNNMTVIQGEKVDSNRRKLGTFLGEGVHTGIGTLIYPGRKIWPGQATLPGEIVTKDKEGENSE